MIDLTPSPHTILEFFIVWVIWRGVVVRWMSDIVRKHWLEPCGKVIKRHLIRTQRDAAIWLHYQNRALNKGHDCKLMECNDDWCKLI